jgi:hypothetical protein
VDAAEFAEQGEEADESAEPSVSAEGAPAAKAGGESEGDSVPVEVTVPSGRDTRGRDIS